jgi:PPOX class probable F420-dependent enzyme
MFDSHSEALLTDAAVIWLTTVRPDGQPQASPVWFVVDEGEFLIYSRANSRRLHNIATNPRVSLNLDSNEGSDVITIEGTARLLDGPSNKDHGAYQAKYQTLIARLGSDPESFAAVYSVPIKVKPGRWRAF